MNKFNRPLRDWRGRALCDPCWNSQHWHYGETWGEKRQKMVTTNVKILDCEQVFQYGGQQYTCQCECITLMNEKHPKPKPDHSQQIQIDAPMEQIGPKGFRDDG